MSASDMPIEDEVRELAEQRGPFASMSFDAGRTDATAEQEINLRVRALAEKLTAAGAPQEDVAALRSAASEPAGVGGELTRLLVACHGTVVFDRVLPGRPPRGESSYGRAPHLLPVIRSRQFPAPYLVVDVDRSGADIDVVGELGAITEAETVEGSQDLLHKVREGGFAHRRMQMRAEDSWHRNAVEIARAIDDLAVHIRPRVIFVDGDPYETASVIRSLHEGTAELVTELGTGGRAAGVDREAQREAIDQALTAHVRESRRQLLGRFREAEAQQQAAVQGLAEVVASLRRGQVSHVLLVDDPTSTATLWAGPDPLQIGMSRDEVADLGVQNPSRMRADAVFTRAAYAAGAEVFLIDPERGTNEETVDAGAVDLTDGIGALLRWSDLSTPHDAAPAMPGHGQ